MQIQLQTKARNDIFRLFDRFRNSGFQYGVKRKVAYNYRSYGTVIPKGMKTPAIPIVIAVVERKLLLAKLVMKPASTKSLSDHGSGHGLDHGSDHRK